MYYARNISTICSMLFLKYNKYKKKEKLNQLNDKMTAVTSWMP